MEYIVPQWTRYHLTDFACSYGEFQKFGSQWFPYAMTCREGGHRQMEVHVAELAAETFNGAELFESPAGTKGKPRDIQVVQPAGKALDETAVGTVGGWRFKPATCNGEPMAQRIEFEVAFRSY